MKDYDTSSIVQNEIDTLRARADKLTADANKKLKQAGHLMREVHRRERALVRIKARFGGSVEVVK